MKDVADAVGMLKGSLYHYIDTKEDLLFAALEQFHRNALQNLELWRAVEGSPLTKLRAFVYGHVTQIALNPVRAAVFHHEFRALSPQRRAVIIESRGIYDRAMRELIDDGKRQREVCPDVDSKLETIALLGMLNSIYQWYRPGGEWAPHEVGILFADHALASLACTPRTHRAGHRERRGRLDADVIAALTAAGIPS